MPVKKTEPPKLLRKPRAPTTLPPLSPPPPSHKTTDYDVYPSKHQLFDSFELSAMEGVTSEISMHSPPPSLEPSYFSPPPSESIVARDAGHMRTYIHVSPQRLQYVPRDERKYVLDPLYRGKTSLGTYVDGKSLVKPYKPRGPDGLPARVPLKNPEIVHDYIDDVRYCDPPTFTLENFMVHIADIQHIPLHKVREAVYSRENYQKITKLLSDKKNEQNPELTMVTLTPESQNIPPAEPRIPQRQLLIEMAAMIKQHVREMMNTDVRSVIRPLPKYSPSHGGAESIAHTEIILFEDTPLDVAGKAVKFKEDGDIPNYLDKDSIFHSARSKFFQGTGRSQSPFTSQDEGVISPSELAILDSLISGGLALSLKAHFISELPDVLPLVKTITYLNLSFNDFRVFPPEILSIQQLEVLKLRDNPLRELPQEISRLSKLKTLTASFCLLSSVPLGLFSLPDLVHLDLSYNKLSFIPNELANLRKLVALNLEGNQLPALPMGALRLNIELLNVKNNFMHPLFWKESTRNQSQRLLDIAATQLYKQGALQNLEKYPEWVQMILTNYSVCDCCHGALYGSGLRLIRPVSRLFGVKGLPFIFCVCSPSCLQVFKTGTEAIREAIYGNQQDMYSGEPVR